MNYVEKCGICEESFEFKPEVDPSKPEIDQIHTIIDTEYLIPKDWKSCSMNILSTVSQLYPCGISFLCNKCSKKIEIELQNKGKIEKFCEKLKYIHNNRNENDDYYYEAFDVKGFKEISEEIQIITHLQVKYANHGNPFYRNLNIAEPDLLDIIKNFFNNIELEMKELAKIKWYIINWIEKLNLKPENYLEKIVEANLKELKEYVVGELLDVGIDPF